MSRATVRLLVGRVRSTDVDYWSTARDERGTGELGLAAIDVWNRCGLRWGLIAQMGYSWMQRHDVKWIGVSRSMWRGEEDESV